MNRQDEKSYLNQDKLRALYPGLPQGQMAHMKARLQGMDGKEAPRMKRKLSLSLAMAMLVLLMALAAIAEVATGAFSELFRAEGLTFSQEGEQLLAADNQGPLHVQPFDEATITIKELASDGRNLFIAADVAPKPGSNVLLIFDVYDGDSGAPHQRQDSLRLARESGKKVLAAAVLPQDGFEKGRILSNTTSEGVLELVVVSQMKDPVAASSDITLALSLAGFIPGDTPRFVYQSAQWSGPGRQYQPQVKEVIVNQQIAETGINIEHLKLYLTPLALYYDISFRMPSSLYTQLYSQSNDHMLDDKVPLQLFDISGNRLKPGYEYAMGGSLDGHGLFQETGSLDLQAFPSAILIKAYDHRDDSYSQALKVEMP